MQALVHVWRGLRESAPALASLLLALEDAAENFLTRLFPSGLFVAVPVPHAPRGMLLNLCELRFLLSMMRGEYERPTIELLRRVIREGMTVVDGGAHYGYVTLLAAGAVGPEGRVFAFEPNPRVHRILRANVARNRCTNVVPLPLALSDRADQLPLALDRRSGWASLLYAPYKVASMEVATTTLDGLLAGRPADLVKLDLQGGEPKALRGMARTCTHPDVRLLVEYWPVGLNRAGVPPAEFLDTLRSMGFDLHVVEARGTRPVTGRTVTLAPGEESANLYLVRRRPE